MHPKITALRLPSGSLGHHTLAATSCQSSRRPAFVAGFELKTQLISENIQPTTTNNQKPTTTNNNSEHLLTQPIFKLLGITQTTNTNNNQPTTTTGKVKRFLLTWQFEPSCLGGLELDSFHDHDGWIHLRIETPRLGYPFQCTENGLKMQRFL